MTNDEAQNKIDLKYQPDMEFECPTCSECGGWGLGFASIEHHHLCEVAAAITDFEALVADDDHWENYLDHEPYTKKKAE